MHQVVLQRIAQLKGELLANTPDYPKTLHSNGLFLFELRFSLEEATESLLVPMTLDLSGYGEIVGLTIPNFRPYAERIQLETFKEDLKSAAQFNYDKAKDLFNLIFIQDTPKRQRTVSGCLIINTNNELTSIVGFLH